MYEEIRIWTREDPMRFELAFHKKNLRILGEKWTSLTIFIDTLSQIYD